MDYMTFKGKQSKNGGVSPRQINYYCSEGRIPGAEKWDGFIDTKRCKKPIDGRTKLGKERKGNGE